MNQKLSILIKEIKNMRAYIDNIDTTNRPTGSKFKLAFKDLSLAE